MSYVYFISLLAVSAFLLVLLSFLVPSFVASCPLAFSVFHRTVESALHGLKLVLRYEYMWLLFGISCLYEVVLTILDYQMKVTSLPQIMELRITSIRSFSCKGSDSVLVRAGTAAGSPALWFLQERPSEHPAAPNIQAGAAVTTENVCHDSGLVRWLLFHMIADIGC